MSAKQDVAKRNKLTASNLRIQEAAKQLDAVIEHTKAEPACHWCGSTEPLVTEYGGWPFCPNCKGV